MPFFMNPFNHEYRGNMVLDDRQYSLTFVVPGNINQGTIMRAFNAGPYNFSGGGVLSINYAKDPDFKGFATLAIDVTGVVASATTADEIAVILNNNPTFAWLFQASVKTQRGRDLTNPDRYLLITSNLTNTELRSFISNTGAETALRFNKRAGVAEIPSYYARHTVANRFMANSDATLIQLDGTQPADLEIIREFTNNPNWSTANQQADWQLLRGRSGLFNFKKYGYDGSSRANVLIEWPAGALAGDLAKKTVYSYTGSATVPSTVAEMPYTLQESDLFIP